MGWNEHVSGALAPETDINPKSIRTTNRRYNAIRFIASSQQIGLWINIGDIDDSELGASSPMGSHND